MIIQNTLSRTPWRGADSRVKLASVAGRGKASTGARRTVWLVAPPNEKERDGAISSSAATGRALPGLRRQRARRSRAAERQLLRSQLEELNDSH